ncbi:DUF3153 domain-containing protein [Cyanobium sp. WAJ14-Wanaka]|uniref:DUF3153 domain-containing protein n=1 Tax=Cyanobium sp. WAJ14-Wanaka TaxID=2823725 RepID=UPI0020CEF9F7|nr:DUF3153 domain-containing protein [Cyanobium sp. WAJ14-Wanaka]MCP9774736.1 DUF3153 domain-containing protein [Cyanobium sp. WAJ14-Wanaka]
MEELAQEDPFLPARSALERGDYGLVLRSLEPLVATFPAATPLGAELQLLMATAWMGQGNSVRAMACCRQVKRCSDANLRAQASDLLCVLEAPALERPREWSISLPSLGEAEPIAGRMQQWASSRRRKKSDDPPPPPVGPTKAPLGFVLVTAVLLLLTLLLGGCMEVHTQVHFQGPGRLQIGYQLQTSRSPIPPWQRQFSQALRRAGLHYSAPERSSGGADDQNQFLLGPVQPAAEALQLLRANLASAAQLAGIQLPKPDLSLKERNWLVGVRQTLLLEIDLRQVQEIAGVQLSIDLDPARPRSIRRAEPQAAQRLAGRRPGLAWQLSFGALNRLELQSWRWSPVGLGGLAIGLGLLLVLTLQRLKVLMGFGLPELPA